MNSSADERPSTPLRYFIDISAMSWRHRGELAAAVSCAVVGTLTALGMSRSLSFLETLGTPARLMVVLASFLFISLIFGSAIAAWRLHRSQGVAIATLRSLVDLNARDRADLEHHLARRYRRREARIDERNMARVDRLEREIAEAAA